MWQPNVTRRCSSILKSRSRTFDFEICSSCISVCVSMSSSGAVYFAARHLACPFLAAMLTTSTGLASSETAKSDPQRPTAYRCMSISDLLTNPSPLPPISLAYIAARKNTQIDG
ncbi:hypothetical protein EVG20_g11693 [Dentipellis fragilis]|uniref:Uncharacterized protein n=1 Tax=Dentipellis fragilis TaxID=205917 RepID=A0A4Y9XJN8_9AGAM|nr:hypothetical protein EVG20_g11693 [Dentipellis fragilis]